MKCPWMKQKLCQRLCQGSGILVLASSGQGWDSWTTSRIPDPWSMFTGPTTISPQESKTRTFISAGHRLYRSFVVVVLTYWEGKDAHLWGEISWINRVGLTVNTPVFRAVITVSSVLPFVSDCIFQRSALPSPPLHQWRAWWSCYSWPGTHSPEGCRGEGSEWRHVIVEDNGTECIFT